jgi:hypothetical protein
MLPNEVGQLWGRVVRHEKGPVPQANLGPYKLPANWWLATGRHTLTLAAVKFVLRAPLGYINLTLSIDSDTMPPAAYC